MAGEATPTLPPLTPEEEKLWDASRDVLQGAVVELARKHYREPDERQVFELQSLVGHSGGVEYLVSLVETVMEKEA